MKTLFALSIAIVMMLTGCVAVPAYQPRPVYSAPVGAYPAPQAGQPPVVYVQPPVYYYPAPAYYPYWGPSIYFGGGYRSGGHRGRR